MAKGFKGGAVALIACCAAVCMLAMSGCNPPGVETHYGRTIDVRAGEAKLQEGMAEADVIAKLGEAAISTHHNIKGVEMGALFYHDVNDDGLVLTVNLKHGLVTGWSLEEGD